MRIWGYVPDYDVEAAFASARANRAFLEGITQVRYRLDREGELVTCPGARPAPDWVTAEGLPVVPLIANQIDGVWDCDLVGHVLGDPSRRRRHVQRIVTCAVDGQHPGVEIDYEFLPATLAEPFSAFIEELAAALHERGKQLAVAVHAKMREPGPDGGPAAQDWPRIGAVADRVAVMTYDFDPSRPGPIAPIAWTREVLALATTRIPSTRVFQGVPLYGYVWRPNAPPAYLTHRDFMELALSHGVTPRRDPVDHHLVLEFAEAGASIEAWLPDAETVAALAREGRRAGVAGYTVWRLGGEEPGALAALAEASPR